MRVYYKTVRVTTVKGSRVQVQRFFYFYCDTYCTVGVSKSVLQRLRTYVYMYYIQYMYTIHIQYIIHILLYSNNGWRVCLAVYTM